MTLNDLKTSETFLRHGASLRFVDGKARWLLEGFHWNLPAQGKWPDATGLIKRLLKSGRLSIEKGHPNAIKHGGSHPDCSLRKEERLSLHYRAHVPRQRWLVWPVDPSGWYAQGAAGDLPVTEKSKVTAYVSFE